MIRAAMVQDVKGSVLSGELTPLLSPCGSYDHHSCGSGELQCCNPHAAAGPVNQDSFSRYGSCTLEKGAIGGAVRHIQGCALGMSDLGGQRMHLGF